MRKVLIPLFRIGLGVIALVVLLAGGLIAYVCFQKRQYSRITDSEVSKALQESHKKQFESRDGAIGLGWQITGTLEGRNIFWHNGGTGGFVSFICLCPGRRKRVGALSLLRD